MSSPQKDLSKEPCAGQQQKHRKPSRAQGMQPVVRTRVAAYTHIPIPFPQVELGFCWQWALSNNSILLQHLGAAHQTDSSTDCVCGCVCVVPRQHEKDLDFIFVLHDRTLLCGGTPAFHPPTLLGEPRRRLSFFFSFSFFRLFDSNYAHACDNGALWVWGREAIA